MKKFTIKNPLSEKMPGFELIDAGDYNMPVILGIMSKSTEISVFADQFVMLHNTELLEETLGNYDFVTLRKTGVPWISMKLYAGKPEAFKKLSELAGKFEVDRGIPIEANWNNFVLNTLGEKCKVIADDSNLFVELDRYCNTKGRIATNVMGKEIAQIIELAKLNAYDIAENLAANLEEERKEPIYED